MARKNLRGGLIGCGFFAVNQMHGWRDADGADIVAICDTNEQRLKVVGEKFGIMNRYRDAEAMLTAQQIDFVDIATTVSSHRALVELAAEYKVPVICQKPFASNIADAKAMVAACEKANIALMVHENFRWQSPMQKVKRVIEAGEIGKPFWARVSFRSGFEVFKAQPYLAEGKRFIIEDLGIHALDIARFLLGDAQNINARIKRVDPDIKGEDVATMLLDHGDGITSIVDCSYATKLETEPFPETLIEIDGDKGTLRLQQGYQMVVTSKQNGTRNEDLSPSVLPWAERPWHNIQESVSAIQQHWADCLQSGTEPQTSGRDNLQTLALVEAAYRSAATGETVKITDILA